MNTSTLLNLIIFPGIESANIKLPSQKKNLEGNMREKPEKLRDQFQERHPTGIAELKRPKYSTQLRISHNVFFHITEEM